MEPRRFGDIKVGFIVKCAQGTKSGEGKVTKVLDNGYFVEFPHQSYPENTCIISGTYFIPAQDVLKVIEDTDANS